jgi:DNA-binding NtrC family response regulator
VRALAEEALRRRTELRDDEADGRGSVAPSVSCSPRMRAVEEALAKVAKTATTVLLQGESGTGKEIAARAIHDASPRATKPFVAVNCAVLSEALLESELFGHEKGAFTGAHAQRRGRIEMADGGTFLLDEIGELHPSLQAKLLRVIEERSFERVGSSKPIDVDVRFIAATHRDLRAMVRAGSFREDMYHRLAVFPITLPPLRERREDIVPIAEVLLGQLATKGRPAPKLSAAAKALLVAASWPGNIRELRNVLERVSDATPAGRAVDATPRLEDLERTAIESALAATRGNRREAAERLGIGLRTLYEKIKRYDLR